VAHNLDRQTDIRTDRRWIMDRNIFLSSLFTKMVETHKRKRKNAVITK